MGEDWLLSVLYGAWLTLSTMPAGFNFGLTCGPCCSGCGVNDNKPRTDPKVEGTWSPSGTWRGTGGVTWAFTANPGNESGNTWFFFGSTTTSRAGGNATIAEQTDWGNLCNWYSSNTQSPHLDTEFDFFGDGTVRPTNLNKRATKLPPDDAVVHFYTDVSTTSTGPRTIRNAYFWGGAELLFGSELTTTEPAHDSSAGTVFSNLNAGNHGTVRNGATFVDGARNFETGVVNGGAVFGRKPGEFAGDNAGTINDGAVFYDDAVNFGNNPGTTNDDGIVNGGATFNNTSLNEGIVNGGATFNGTAENRGFVYGNAVFNDGTVNDRGVFGGATFNDTSVNDSSVFGLATFNDNSYNSVVGYAEDAVFNDAACSRRFTGEFSVCNRKFWTGGNDPVCNGTASNGCANAADTCGCG